MASPDHCRALLAPEFQHLGAGVARHTEAAVLPGAPDQVWHDWVVDLGVVGAKWSSGAGCPVTDLVTPAPPLPPGGDEPASSVVPDGPALVMSAGVRLERRGRAAQLVLRCARPTGTCRGTATLRAAGSRRGAKRVLGRASVRIPAGAMRTVRVPLRRGARRLLARRRKLRATLQLAVDGVRTNRAVTLRARGG
jgi:hypothetical protein